MTSRWLWWMPLGLLILSAAAMGLRLGWIRATITESDVIAKYAQRYVDSHGPDARLSDCVGLSGESLPEIWPRIWIMIRCGPPANGQGESYVYYVNRLGGFEYGERPEGHRRQPWEQNT